MASDAVKVAEYRSALRLRSSMLQAGSWGGLEDEAAYKNFSRILSKARSALLLLGRTSSALFSPASSLTLCLLALEYAWCTLKVLMRLLVYPIASLATMGRESTARPSG